MIESNRQNYYILGTLSESENGEIRVIIPDTGTDFNAFLGRDWLKGTVRVMNIKFIWHSKIFFTLIRC